MARERCRAQRRETAAALRKLGKALGGGKQKQKKEKREKKGKRKQEERAEVRQEKDGQQESERLLYAAAVGTTEAAYGFP